MNTFGGGRGSQKVYGVYIRENVDIYGWPLNVFKIPNDFDMLFKILSHWLFLLRFYFRIRPKQLKSAT